MTGAEAELLDKIELFLDDDELFDQFKSESKMYAKGQSDPETYLRSLVKLFGADVAKKLTPKIASLIPDADRQEDLLQLYRENVGRNDHDSDLSSSESEGSSSDDDDEYGEAGATPTLAQLTLDENVAASNLGVAAPSAGVQSSNDHSSNNGKSSTVQQTSSTQQPSTAQPSSVTQQAGAQQTSFDPMDPLGSFAAQAAAEKAEQEERLKRQAEVKRIRDLHFQEKEKRLEQELKQQEEFLQQQDSKRSAHLVANATVEKLRDECLKTVTSAKQLNTASLDKIVSEQPWEFTPWDEKMVAACLACKQKKVVPVTEKIIKGWRILSVNGAGKEQDRLLVASREALYRVNFDWRILKPRSFERQEWRDIREIQYGPFSFGGQRSDDDFEFGVRIVPRQQVAKTRIPGLKAKRLDKLYRTFKARDPPIFDESFEPTLEWMRDYYKSVALEIAWLCGALMRIARKQFSLVATNCNTNEVSELDVNSKRRHMDFVALNALNQKKQIDQKLQEQEQDDDFYASFMQHHDQVASTESDSPAVVRHSVQRPVMGNADL